MSTEPSRSARCSGGGTSKGTPAAALEFVDALVEDGALSNSYLLPSVRGELLIQLERFDEARKELEYAITLCGNERERAVLRGKVDALPL